MSWVGWRNRIALARGRLAVCVICVYHNQVTLTPTSPSVFVQMSNIRGDDSRYRSSGVIGHVVCINTIDNVDSDVRKYQTERGLQRATESHRQTMPFDRKLIIR